MHPQRKLRTHYLQAMIEFHDRFGALLLHFCQHNFHIITFNMTYRVFYYSLQKDGMSFRMRVLHGCLKKVFDVLYRTQARNERLLTGSALLTVTLLRT